MQPTHLENPIDLIIAIPIYNDWESLRALLSELNEIPDRIRSRVGIVVINDGSNVLRPAGLFKEFTGGNLEWIDLINLHINLGHQSAIVTGLSEIYKNYQYQMIIVMDADGEDKPVDVSGLIQAHLDHPNKIIVAQRAQRSENYWFRFFYALYKLAFRILVGKKLDYGNFCLIPQKIVSRIVFNPMSWNHLAAAISGSKLEIVRIKTVRGKRYSGRSNMGFERLVSHGLSAISVSVDTMMIRILLVSTLITLFSGIGVLSVIALRFLTNLAIPGWATSAVGILAIIGLQGLILSTMASFIILRGRSGIFTIPAIDSLKFIANSERVVWNE